MSGHSKWSQIKRQKSVADIKRGQTFTKISNAITIAVKAGGSADPETNFKLRLSIEQARTVNMPKENIQRAIERGLGKAGGVALEEVVYEGYGPAGIAVLVEATTENKKRTGQEIKNIFERAGGHLSGPGSVAWQFTKEGLILVKLSGKTAEEIILAAADLGAHDAAEVEDGVEVYTHPEDLESIKEKLKEQGFEVAAAEISAKPQNTVVLSDMALARKVLEFMEKLEACDEVQKVHGNFDIPEEVLKQIE